MGQFSMIFTCLRFTCKRANITLTTGKKDYLKGIIRRYCIFFSFTYPINDDLTCVLLNECVVLKTNVEKLFADFLKDFKYFNVQKILMKCSSCHTSKIV